MKNIYGLVFTLWFVIISISGNAQTPDSWSSIVSGVTARYGAVCFEMNNKLYFGTGRTSTSVLKDFWEYDPVTGTWMQMSSLTIARYDATAFVVNYVGMPLSMPPYVQTGEVAVVGGGRGFSDNVLSSYSMFDPYENLWNSVSLSGSLGSRYGAVVIPHTQYIIDLSVPQVLTWHKAYVGLGINSTGTFLNDFYEITATYPTNSLVVTSRQNFPGTARAYAAGFSLGDSCYTGTGKDAEGLELNDIWKYRISDNTWTQLNNFAGGTRSGSVAFAIGNTGYFFGGSGSTDLYSYNIKQDSWSAKQGLGGASRYFPEGDAANGAAYAGTGYDNNTNYYSDMYAYTPEKFLIIPVYKAQPEFCRGINVRIPFLSGGIGLNSGNQFMAELSDLNGSFSSPAVIGTLSGTTPQDIIFSTLPGDLAESTNYQIRISSTNSAFTGSSKKVSIYPFKEPSISIASDHGSNICADDNVTFTATPVNGGNAPHYLWKKNNIDTGTDSPVFITNTLVNGDVISCTLISNFVCATSSTANSNPITMTVTALPPTPVITADGTILSSDAPSGNQWYDQNGLIIGATSKNYTATASGVYYVIVKLSGCSSEASNSINLVITNVDGRNEEAGIRIYPNPFSDELIIEYDNNTDKAYFEILNTLGEVIYKNYMYNKAVIPVSNFPAGLYIIRIEGTKQFQAEWVVKN